VPFGARKNTHVEERLEARAEESAEQVLARLERYAATLRARPPVLVPPAPRATNVQLGDVDVAAVIAAATLDARPAPLVDTLIPSHEELPSRPRRFAWEVAPALIAVTVCSFVILLSEWFDVGVAAAVVGVLMLIGMVGLVRRVPLARAYTFGLVIAALLIRLS
jgi:hypothetical protein